MDQYKKEFDLISELKRHRNSDVLQAVLAYIGMIELRKTEELIRAKQEAVPLIQGAIQALRALRDSINGAPL